MPTYVDRTTFDLVHWVRAAEAFRPTRQLHRDHALFLSPTSGAAYPAEWWALRNPGFLFAVVFPDEGDRYQDAVCDDAWLEEGGLRRDAVPSEPVECAVVGRERRGP